MLLRMDEEMSIEVRMFSEFEHRPLSDELRHLIAIGLDQKRRMVGEETMRVLRQLASTGSNGAGPMSTSGNSRQVPSRKFA